MRHLTPQSCRGLLDGTLPADEARRLAEHLAQDCDACEEVLRSLPDADAADGWVDGALGALAQAAPARVADLAVARLERRLASEPVRRTRLGPVAIAAAVLLAGVTGLLVARGGLDRSRWDGDKGASPAAVPLRLRFLVVSAAPGAAPAIEKGVSGETVGSSASLAFEIEAGRAADAALLRVPSVGEPEVLWRDRLVAGRTEVSLDGRPAAYPVADLSGPQRFVVVASDAPLDQARAAHAAAALAPPGRMAPDVPGLDGLSFDVVEVIVR